MGALVWSCRENCSHRVPRQEPARDRIVVVTPTSDERSSHLKPWPVAGPPRVVFEHPLYPTVLEEDVQLPNGSVVQWLRYRDHRDGLPVLDGVLGICIEHNSVLLCRQYNPGAGRIVWEFPGGGTLSGESYEEAVRRELMEEVGYFPNKIEYLGRFLLNNRRSGQGVRTFLATDLEARQLPPDDEEHIESLYVPLARVDDLIRSGELDNSTALAAWAIFRAIHPGRVSWTSED